MNRSFLLKLITLVVVVLFSGFTYKASTSTAVDPSLKQILLNQLKTTHNKTEWFVPVNTAVEGLTPEQAMWKDKSGNHSVGQLAKHLIFWNERQLIKFKGTKLADFNGSNEETFPNSFDKNTWPETVKKLDQVLTELEALIEASDETKLKEWYETIANINTHNAYHTGQIIFVRKLAGNWDPAKGVK